MRYLLDTNIVSNPANLAPSAKVTAKLRAYQGQMAIASVTWQELVYGMKRLPAGSARQQSLSWYLILIGSQIPVLPFDRSWSPTIPGISRSSPGLRFRIGRSDRHASVQGSLDATKTIGDPGPFSQEPIYRRRARGTCCTS